MRSLDEGGAFAGDEDDCARLLAPFVPLVRYVDLERRFRALAPACREAGCTIIASAHLATMLPLPELFGLERELRSYGDLPKLVLAPSSDDDLLDLLSFTHAATKAGLHLDRGDRVPPRPGPAAPLRLGPRLLRGRPVVLARAVHARRDARS